MRKKLGMDERLFKGEGMSWSDLGLVLCTLKIFLIILAISQFTLKCLHPQTQQYLLAYISFLSIRLPHRKSIRISQAPILNALLSFCYSIHPFAWPFSNILPLTPLLNLPILTRLPSSWFVTFCPASSSYFALYKLSHFHSTYAAVHINSIFTHIRLLLNKYSVEICVWYIWEFGHLKKSFRVEPGHICSRSEQLVPRPVWTSNSEVIKGSVPS
jgi:hypothetical protein